MEAEDVDKTPAGFLKIPDTEASGGHALAIPVHAAKGVGAAQYSSGKIAPGTYELYARVYWTDGCSNSLRFSVGNVEISLTSDIYNKWHLLHSPRKIRITDPPQTLSIHNLENGVRIDYWGLRPVAD